MRKLASLVLCCTLVALAPAPGRSAEAPPIPTAALANLVELTDGAVVVTLEGRRHTLTLPARALAMLVVADELYVALGEDGVSVFRLSATFMPALLRHVPTGGGRAIGLHAAEREVWMELQSLSAVPVAHGRAPSEAYSSVPSREAAPAVAGPVPATRTAQPKLKLLKLVGGSVELSGGNGAGIKVGDRFAIFRSAPLGPAEAGGFLGRELAAVVEVVAVKSDSALAELTRGARVTLADEVEPAGDYQNPSMLFPARLGGLAELSATLRPLVKVGTPLGLGALAELSGTWIGSSWFGGVRVQPLGLGWTKDGNVISVSATGEGGYDTRAFAVGLGVGVSAVNGDLDYLLRGSIALDSSGGQPTYTQHTRTAFTLTQVARLGARDGLNAQLSNVLLYHRDSDGQAGFLYAGTSGRLSVPVTPRTDFFLEGGGGVMGYGYGGVGVFSWINGVGDAGSLGVSVSAGGAGVGGSKAVTHTDMNGTPYTTNESVTIAGPMVSVGIVIRMKP